MDEREALKSSDLPQRVAAAEALSQMGPDAAFAACELVNACGDDDVVRDYAVAALEELGPPPTELLAELTALTSSADPLVVYWATTLIGRAGVAARSCEHAIAAVLANASDTAVQQRAAWALGKMEATSDQAIDTLRRAASSTDARLARLANTSLQQVQP